MRRTEGACCPSCRPTTGGSRRIAVVLLGVAVAGCPEPTTTPQPAYGVQVTETADTADAE